MNISPELSCGLDLIIYADVADFLASFFVDRPDPMLLDRLAALPVPEDYVRSVFARGYHFAAKGIHAYLDEHGSAALEALIPDWEALFRGGAGIPSREGAFRGLDGKEDEALRAELDGMYREYGWECSGNGDAPGGDGMGTELRFMAHLLRRMADGLDKQGSAKAFDGLRLFLGRHILAWMPDFCRKAEQAAATELYRHYLRLTASYLAYFDEVLAGA